MTPHDLIADFEVLAEAPEGMARLRELVLQLAVQGKLVPQDPADEPASLLLERIVMEKARLVKEGKIPKPKALPPVSKDEAPFEVPETWALVPFGDVFANVFTGPFGTSLKKSEYQQGGTPVINPQNLRGGSIQVTPDTCIGPATLRRLSSFQVAPRDLVVARRGEMGRCAVVRDHEGGWLCGTGSLVLRPASVLFTEFAAMYLRSPWTVARLSGDSVGATMSNLNQRIMLNLPFGLPPLAEQHRIVARVDELMCLLDRLEAARSTREGTRVAMRDSALAALRDADTPEGAEAAWQRIAERMDDLFTHPADVDPLRQAVLQLAVRGRLVPQDPEDEPASLLLDRIAAKKARLVKEGKIRRAEPWPPVSEDEVPFEVPEPWVWCRAGDIFEFVTSGSRGWAQFYADSGPLFLRIGNLDYHTTSLDLSNVQRVSPPGNAEGRRTAVVAGDILISITGDTGMVGLVPDGLGEAYINQHIAMCRPMAGVLPSLLARICTSLLVRGQLWGHQRGIKNSLGLEDIRAILLPLPPLTEQHRIVARVDELMDLLVRLEQHLVVNRDMHDAYAAAAVHHLDA